MVDEIPKLPPRKKKNKLDPAQLEEKLMCGSNDSGEDFVEHLLNGYEVLKCLVVASAD